MAIAKVGPVTFLHSRFRFLLLFSSWLKTLLPQCTSHASSSCSTQTEILNLPVNHTSGVMWLNTVLWLVRTPKCGVINCSWPCPRPFPSVQNRAWPRETSGLLATITDLAMWRIIHLANRTSCLHIPCSKLTPVQPTSWGVVMLTWWEHRCPLDTKVKVNISLDKMDSLVR